MAIETLDELSHLTWPEFEDLLIAKHAVEARRPAPTLHCAQCRPEERVEPALPSPAGRAR